MKKDIKIVVIMIIVVVIMIATLGMILLVKNNSTKSNGNEKISPNNISENNITINNTTENNIDENTVSDNDESYVSNNSNISKTVENLKVDGQRTPYVLYPAKGVNGGLLCKVYKVSSSSNEIQIVAINPVENVELGSNDTSITPDGPNDEYIALKSYNNAVELLNRRAENYMDEKGMAKDARCIGCYNKNEESRYYKGSYEYLNTYNINGKCKSSNGRADDDCLQLDTVYAFDITDNKYTGYWLASRTTNVDSENAKFGLHYVGNSHTISTVYLWQISSQGVIQSESMSLGLRPVFTLNSDKVKITSGAGTETNPYILDLYNGESEESNTNIEYNYDHSQPEMVHAYASPNRFMYMKDYDKTEFIFFSLGRDELKNEYGGTDYCEMDASKAPTLRFKTVVPGEAEVMYNGINELGVFKFSDSWAVGVIREDYSNENELNEKYLKKYNENKEGKTVTEETKLVINGIEWDVIYTTDTYNKTIYCSTKQGNSGVYLRFLLDSENEKNTEYTNNFIGYMTLTD